MIQIHLLLLWMSRISVYAQSSNYPDCQSGPLAQFPICDQSLPSRLRAADIVSQMTTAEKITQMATTAAAIPRLGIPKYQWWSEALHGVAYAPGVTFDGDLPAATSFAAPINLGASFNTRLIYRVANAISTEARAFNNEGQAGLTFFTPNINIFRDPRWGRGQETPGEDPFLTSQYVYALINGLQRGEDDRYLKMAANCKHFDAYDLDQWNGTDRFHFNALVSNQDLVETYLPPFETCIRDVRVASIMCSFNAINGVPACANKFLIDTIARKSFYFDGFVISDCGGIDTIMYDHNFTSTVEDTVAAALLAGTDLDCGTFYQRYAQQALDNKTIVESDIDRALERTYNALIRLGWFDPPEQQFYRHLNKNHVNTVKTQQLALDSAQESIVLLKNVNNALPLNINELKNKKIALIGPTANATILMQSNYYGRAPYLIDPVLGFKSITAGTSIDIEFAYGCAISGTDESDFTAAIELASVADVVIFFGGLDQSIEAEGCDRSSIALPRIQYDLLKRIEDVVQSPIHVVIMSGSGIDLTFVRDSSLYGSLIWMGYPGQAGGLAIANAIFGEYNPAGRLPITFYPASYVDEVSMTDMQMRPSATNPGRTYKFYTGKAVYDFGTGLSYTTFVYSWNDQLTSFSYSIDLLMKDNYDEKHVLTVLLQVNVTNTGAVAGDDVVLAYILPPQLKRNGQTPPIKQLFGFKRIHLNVNETGQVFFPLEISAILTVAHDGSKWLHPGIYHILIGQTLMRSIELQGKSARWS
ncbi:unnamed protein product [Rotaria magnacalcarata]|uniref:Fibronectin type III-like domain-containing protein n=1 Tax=Rotaria magnacalcarata TaxID=392030 RepID=A0A816RMA3_9BILA|nr:unnamed protein product [Rotaria magnacalcarata]CAF4106713.1 unnamed protein product [Rotaria magnacalcarata]